MQFLSAFACLCMAGCAHAWDVQEVNPLEIENSTIIAVAAHERAKCDESDMPLLCDAEFDVVDQMFRIAERALFTGVIAHRDSEEQQRLFAIARSAHEAGIRRMDEISAAYIRRSQEVSKRSNQ